MSDDRYLMVFQWGDGFDLAARSMSEDSAMHTFPVGTNGRYERATDAVVAAHLREADEGFEYGVVCSPEVITALEEESSV